MGWHDYFTGSDVPSRIVGHEAKPPTARTHTEAVTALDQVELPKVRRAQQLLDEIQSPDDDGYRPYVDPDVREKLEEVESIVDSLTPGDDLDSESDFERVQNP